MEVEETFFTVQELAQYLRMKPINIKRAMISVYLISGKFAPHHQNLGLNKVSAIYIRSP